MVIYDGVEGKKLLSTTKLSTKTMGEFLDNCMRYGAENGFYFDGH